MKTTTVWMLCVVVVMTSASPLGKQRTPDQNHEIPESQDMSDIRSPDQGDGQPNPHRLDMDPVPEGDRKPPQPEPVEEPRQPPKEGDGKPPQPEPVKEPRQPPILPGPDRGPVPESDGKRPDLKPVARAWLNKRRPDNSRPADKLPPKGYMQKMISHIRDGIERFRTRDEEKRKPLTNSKLRPMLSDSDNSRSSGTEEGGEKRPKPKVLDAERVKSEESEGDDERAKSDDRSKQTEEGAGSKLERVASNEDARSKKAKSEEGIKRLESSEHWRRIISRIRATFVKSKVSDDESIKSGEESRRPKSSEPEHVKLPARVALTPLSNMRRLYFDKKIKSGDGSKRSDVKSGPKPVRVAPTQDARSDRAKSGEESRRPKSSEPEHVKLPARVALTPLSNMRRLYFGKKTQSGDGSKRSDVKSGPKPVRVAATQDARSDRAKSGEDSRRPKSSEPEHVKLPARVALMPLSNMRRLYFDKKTQSGDGSKRSDVKSGPKPVRVAPTQDARSDRAKSGEESRRPKSSEPAHVKLPARDAVKQTSNPEVRHGKKTGSGDGSRQTGERAGPKPPRLASTENAGSDRAKTGDGSKRSISPKSEWAKRPGSSEPEEFKLKAHHDVSDSTKTGVRGGKMQARASGVHQDRELGSSSDEKSEDSFASGQSRQSRQSMHSRKSSR